MFHSYPPLLFWFLLLRFPVSIQTLLQLHFYCILPETAFSSFFPALFSSAFSGRNPWSYASEFFYLTDDPVHIDRFSRPPLHLVRRQLPLPGNNSLHTLHFLCPHLLYSSNIFRFPAFSIYACSPFCSARNFSTPSGSYSVWRQPQKRIRSGRWRQTNGTCSIAGRERTNLNYVSDAY